jgi:hypothetical protein
MQIQLQLLLKNLKLRAEKTAFMFVVKEKQVINMNGLFEAFDSKH